MHNREFTIQAKAFSLADTLNCGQCFRWVEEEGGFTGPVQGRLVHLRQSGDCIYVSGIAEEVGSPLLCALFSLDEDYESYHEILRRHEPLRTAVDFAPGIRVMKQPLWESLCTFILSQNNNIPRITMLVRRLCEMFNASGADCPLFPSAQQICSLGPDGLGELRAGFRTKYLLDAAHRFSEGSIDEEFLRTAPLDKARGMLMQIYGVGPKVADCVLLFGAARYEAFPMDVWMKKSMTHLFPQGLPQEAQPIAGIAQQYIFHYARTSGILDHL